MKLQKTQPIANLSNNSDGTVKPIRSRRKYTD